MWHDRNHCMLEVMYVPVKKLKCGSVTKLKQSGADTLYIESKKHVWYLGGGWGPSTPPLLTPPHFEAQIVATVSKTPLRNVGKISAGTPPPSHKSWIRTWTYNLLRGNKTFRTSTDTAMGSTYYRSLQWILFCTRRLTDTQRGKSSAA